MVPQVCNTLPCPVADPASCSCPEGEFFCSSNKCGRNELCNLQNWLGERTLGNEIYLAKHSFMRFFKRYSFAKTQKYPNPRDRDIKTLEKTKESRVPNPEFPGIRIVIRKYSKGNSLLFFSEFRCQHKNCNECLGWGDPHIVTFDNAKNDVYGIAQYTMSESSGTEQIPPYKFKVNKT